MIPKKSDQKIIQIESRQRLSIKMEFQCRYCHGFYKSQGGLTRHTRSCPEYIRTLSNNATVINYIYIDARTQQQLSIYQQSIGEFQTEAIKLIRRPDIVKHLCSASREEVGSLGQNMLRYMATFSPEFKQISKWLTSDGYEFDNEPQYIVDTVGSNLNDLRDTINEEVDKVRSTPLITEC